LIVSTATPTVAEHPDIYATVLLFNGVVDAFDCIGITTIAIVTQKLQRHDFDIPINTSDACIVIANGTDGS